MKLYVYFNGQDEFTNTHIQHISLDNDDILDCYVEDFEVEDGTCIDVLAEIRHTYPDFYEKFKEDNQFIFGEWPE